MNIRLRYAIAPALMAGMLALSGCVGAPAPQRAGAGAHHEPRKAPARKDRRPAPVTVSDPVVESVPPASASASSSGSDRQHGCYRYDREGKRFWDSTC